MTCGLLSLAATANGFIQGDCVGSLVRAKDIIGNCTSSVQTCCDPSTRGNIKSLVSTLKVNCEQNINQTVITGLEVGTIVLDLACEQFVSEASTHALHVFWLLLPLVFL